MNAGEAVVMKSVRVEWYEMERTNKYCTKTGDWDSKGFEETS